MTIAALLLLSSQRLTAQDSCTLRISLLTCTPGEALYSSFGHTAVRVRNGAQDLIFNYGTFEFSPDFYMEFVKGKLLYYLSVDEFSNFLVQYRYESRSIFEQELHLSCAEKDRLANALFTNALPDQRTYLYDFLFDNCSTRPRDVFENALPGMKWTTALPAGSTTFRDLIHSYLHLGGQYWSKFGIDILLGSRMDAVATNRQSFFLPDYLMRGLEGATYGGKPLAGAPVPVLQLPSPLNSGSLFRPALIISLLIPLALLLHRRPRAIAAFDSALFLLLGLAGCLLVFMWTGTNHALCRDNFNLWWAFPLHVAAPFASRGRKWSGIYWKGTTVLLATLLLAWPVLPQDMHEALLPLLAVALWRAAARSGWIARKKVDTTNGYA